MLKYYVVVVIAVTLLCPAISSLAATMEVNSQANIFASGHSSVSAPGGGGAGVLPACYSFTISGNGVLTFTSVTGTVSCGPGSSGADGGLYASGNTDILSWTGISGIKNDNATMFLTGVFLTDAEPADPAPDRLDFTNNTDFTELSPAIAQTFFIGDGLTGTGSGEIQKFYVPAGATRLFLGFADAYDFGSPSSYPGYYGDNSGTLSAAFEITPIPEPGSLLAMGIGFIGMIGFVTKYRRTR